ncbi:hypothetical protein [Streptomyces sp. NPDC001661]
MGAAQEQEQTPSEPTQEEEVAQWVSEVSPHWGDLEQAFSDFDAATTDQAMIEACNDGLAAVIALRQVTPYPPDPELWNSMLEHLGAGLAACISGDVVGASTQLALSVSVMEQLRAEVDQYAGQRLWTSARAGCPSAR